MLSRPTTDQVLEGIRRDLNELVLPNVHDEPTRVAIQMMDQLLRGAAVRAAHEIAWMLEEIEQITGAAAAFTGDPATAGALAELTAAGSGSLHLADVVARYSLAGNVLGCAIEAAYAAGDQDQIDRLRALLATRSEHEMQVVGQLDLVGRG